MSATARKHEDLGPIDPASIGIDAGSDRAEHSGTEYATRGARALAPHTTLYAPLLR